MAKTLLTTVDAADYLCVSVAFLERDRWAGATIPYVQVGSRAIRYRRQELDEFIESRIKHSAILGGYDNA